MTNRHPRVVLRGTYSSWTSVLSGVLQGTVLGLILFLIYINDIIRNIQSQCKLFADDMKVYEVQRNGHEDAQTLQEDLNTLEQWSTECQLSFITTKCEAMRISTGLETVTSATPPHRNGVAEVTGSNPVEALIFFKLFPSN